LLHSNEGRLDESLYAHFPVVTNVVVVSAQRISSSPEISGRVVQICFAVCNINSEEGLQSVADFKEDRSNAIPDCPKDSVELGREKMRPRLKKTTVVASVLLKVVDISGKTTNISCRLGTAMNDGYSGSPNQPFINERPDLYSKIIVFFHSYDALV
jgi:hypothetical protein